MDKARFLRPQREPDPVKFILAVTSCPGDFVTKALQKCQKEFGEIDARSPVFEFQHTSYYEREMGSGLQKRFCSFHDLHQPTALVDRKLFTLELEREFSVKSRRKINLDPAYMELAKLVVASSKNFSHRIHLGKGVYGDLQLRYKDNKFLGHEWTYPDYEAPLATSFFTQVREIYLNQSRERS